LVVIFFALIAIQLAYAQSFEVLERFCEGNYLIAKVREVSGATSYRILDYCPYGCRYGVCLSKKEVPLVGIKEIYNVKACSDNVIFVSITNIGGTKGDLSLSIAGEASRWIRYPEKVSVDVNETKTIAIVASIPCNVTSGTYSFTLVGKGVIEFYAPSALNIVDSKAFSLPITTTVTPIDIKLALVAAILIVFFYLVFRYSFRKTKEERFLE